MSANRLLLVCSVHPSIEEAFCIGERANGEGQYTSTSNKRLDEWYGKHMGCSRGCDHFKLAYHRPRDWDVSTPAESTPAGAVRLALVSEGKH